MSTKNIIKSRINCKIFSNLFIISTYIITSIANIKAREVITLIPLYDIYSYAHSSTQNLFGIKAKLYIFIKKFAQVSSLLLDYWLMPFRIIFLSLSGLSFTTRPMGGVPFKSVSQTIPAE